LAPKYQRNICAKNVDEIDTWRENKLICGSQMFILEKLKVNWRQNQIFQLVISVLNRKVIDTMATGFNFLVSHRRANFFSP